MTAYYNENDPQMAAWLDALIDEGEIAYGVVDTRSILDVRPVDLIGFTQCHFFAGIGVWSRALREAGWPDERPVWTGSCPCQPFSQAGQGLGFADERHLWPGWFHLIQVGQPGVVFGEQVNSPDGRAWLDLISSDLDHEGYAFGPIGLVSCGFGSPDIRERNYFVGYADWMGNADCTGSQGWTVSEERRDQRLAGSGGMARWVADSEGVRWGEKCALSGGVYPRDRAERIAAGLEYGGSAGGLADPSCQQRHGSGDIREDGRAQSPNCSDSSRMDNSNGASATDEVRAGRQLHGASSDLGGMGDAAGLGREVALLDGRGGAERLESGKQMSLEAQAHLMRGPARITASGEMLTGYSATILMAPSGGQLRPGHSRWLMGLPPVWDYCGVMAMRSTSGPPRVTYRRSLQAKLRALSFRLTILRRMIDDVC